MSFELQWSQVSLAVFYRRCAGADSLEEGNAGGLSVSDYPQLRRSEKRNRHASVSTRATGDLVPRSSLRLVVEDGFRVHLSVPETGTPHLTGVLISASSHS